MLRFSLYALREIVVCLTGANLEFGTMKSLNFCNFDSKGKRMKLSHYDYLVVGAGISSAVFCHEAAKLGKTCLVIDRRDHIAGNIYTEDVQGINASRSSTTT